MYRLIPPPAAFAIAIAGMWFSTRYIPLARFSLSYQVPIAVALVAVGLLVVILSLRLFVHAGTTPDPRSPERASELVTSGVYRLSRNPMYLGDSIMLLGIGLWFGSLAALACIAVFIVYTDRVQISREETALRDRFGERYADYCARVRRWL